MKSNRIFIKLLTIFLLSNLLLFNACDTASENTSNATTADFDFEEVNKMKSPNRGGIGSTGLK